jgi:hypothetical protein
VSVLQAAVQVVAYLTGNTAGVDCADQLSEQLDLRTNGTGIPNRRDKKIHQELMKTDGMRTFRQAEDGTF